MLTLPTWAGRSSFSYTGSVRHGTKITYGTGSSMTISADQYAALLNHFRGRTVNIGTSRTHRHPGSVGDWLRENVTKVAVASYVGAILIEEGYAEKVRDGEPEIRFFHSPLNMSANDPQRATPRAESSQPPDTLTEIADALDTLADIMVSDGMEELAGYNASFWRDAALHLRQLAAQSDSHREW
jgi:hypothetical protein